MDLRLYGFSNPYETSVLLNLSLVLVSIYSSFTPFLGLEVGLVLIVAFISVLNQKYFFTVWF